MPTGAPSSPIRLSSSPDGGGKFTSIATDTTPNQFTFTDVTSAALSTIYTSNTVTITGINSAAAISITGGTYSINSGSYTGSSGTITNNQTVTVRGTASGSNATAVNVVLTVGGVSDTYTITTLASSGATLLTRLSTATIPIGNATVPSAVNGWTMGYYQGATLSVANDGTYDYLRAQFPIPGAGQNFFAGGYTPASLQQELFIQFYARMPGVKQGCKFIKLFGDSANSGSEYANTTFGIEYGTGNINAVSYGNGVTVGGYTNSTTFTRSLANDTQSVVDYDPSATWNVDPRSRDSGSVVTQNGVFSASSWGTGWHKFQLRAKLNSGTTALNEVNDGAYEVWIDDVLQVKALNMWNRHYLNAFYGTINLFGWSQTGTQAFEVHIRDGMTVSTGGWVA